MEDDTFELRHFRDVLELLAVTSQRSAAGDTFIVGFDLDHVMQLILPIEVEGQSLLEWVELLGELWAPGEGMLIVSDRSDETPADRPTDEAEWDALAAACDRAEVVLLDWFVLHGTYTFALSQLGTHPPGWDEWGIATPLGKPAVHRRRCRKGA